VGQSGLQMESRGLAQLVDVPPGELAANETVAYIQGRSVSTNASSLVFDRYEVTDGAITHTDTVTLADLLMRTRAPGGRSMRAGRRR